MTKEFIDSIVKQLKEYVDTKLRGWGLSDKEKSLVAFEQKYMPCTKYSGQQSVDHVLFRKFLRRFAPDDIKNDIIRELNKEIAVIRDENEALRKKIQEIEQLLYAAL